MFIVYKIENMINTYNIEETQSKIITGIKLYTLKVQLILNTIKMLLILIIRNVSIM